MIELILNRFAKILFTLVAVLTLAIAGCNTTEGAGRDIEAAGEEIEEGFGN
ncbi:MAG: entericidin A/B family lipoprotein [Phycisphaerae bacterium]